ncbi:hypothetical protein C0J52_27356 [Blattella germanica]|nr:hypothetical protein C0J52_27356 [Blattella germanica]
MEMSGQEPRAYIDIAVLCGKMRENVTHNAIIFHDLILKLNYPLLGRRFHTREDIANRVRRDIKMGNGEADGIGRLPHR